MRIKHNAHTRTNRTTTRNTHAWLKNPSHSSLLKHVFSLGGHQPYVPILLTEDDARKSGGANSTAPGPNVGPNNANNSNNQYSVGNSTNNESKQRARVLCSYDAKDSTELNLSANEVSGLFLLWLLHIFDICFFLSSLRDRSFSWLNWIQSTMITCMASKA